MQTETPTAFEEAARLLGDASREGLRVRFRGGGTKAGWGRVVDEPDLEISSAGLDRIVEHDAADLTAVLQAGVRLADAQRAFGEQGQMLALDPPLGEDGAATIGGVVAAGDSGPLRQGCKGPRDLLLGMRVCLSDGTLARSGGKVIKNVAGYDLAKLFCGSFGTLGMIVEVAVRLHPRPERTVTAVGVSPDPEAVQRAVLAVSHAPLQADGLDVAWKEGRGEVLVRFGGADPATLADRALGLMRSEGLEGRRVEDDEARWDRQREGQRARSGAVVRVSGRQGSWGRVLDVAQRTGATVVGRGALGLAWLHREEDDPGRLAGWVEQLREELAPFPCVVLDAPPEVRRKVDPWGEADGPALRLMRSVKARFDPAATCNPGIYVGGI